eukprot:scaffold122599_cov51-Prasinocladus_malaysianus.AAC.1
MADDENQEQAEQKIDLFKKYRSSILESHMTTAFEKDAVQFSLEAFHTYRHLKDIAQHIKQVSFHSNSGLSTALLVQKRHLDDQDSA